MFGTTLPKGSYRLLKRIEKNQISQHNILDSETDSFYQLLNLGFIRCSNPTEGYTDDEPVGGYIYKITLNGIAYLEFCNSNKREHLISRIMSGISLVVTIANIIFQIVKC